MLFKGLSENGLYSTNYINNLLITDEKFERQVPFVFFGEYGGFLKWYQKIVGWCVSMKIHEHAIKMDDLDWFGSPSMEMSSPGFLCHGSHGNRHYTWIGPFWKNFWRLVPPLRFDDQIIKSICPKNEVLQMLLLQISCLAVPISITELCRSSATSRRRDWRCWRKPIAVSVAVGVIGVISRPFFFSRFQDFNHVGND